MRDEDERFSDENCRANAADTPPPPLTAAQQREIADLVRYGRPVTDLDDIATYPATA